MWDAPAGCPTADAVRGNVERMLSDPERARAPLSATAHVSVAPARAWQASLTLDVGGRRTERRFQAESCDAVAAAAALIIALAVDGDLAPTPASPSPVPAPPAGAPAAATSVDSVDSTVAVVQRSGQARFDPGAPSQIFLDAGGVFDWSTLPEPSAPGVEASVGWKRWRTERRGTRVFGGVSYFPPHQLPYISEKVFGDWWMLALSARGCLSLAAGPLEIGPCLGGEVPIMHASTTTISKDTLPTELVAWFSLLASATASLNIWGPVAMVLRADLVVPTSRPSFGSRDHDDIIPLYRVPATAFRLALGLEWALR